MKYLALILALVAMVAIGCGAGAAEKASTTSPPEPPTAAVPSQAGTTSHNATASTGSTASTSATASSSTLPPGKGEAYIDGILSHSVEVVDPSGDWISTGHEIDNPGVYPVDFADINSLAFGVDDHYLYVKLTVNGVFPEAGGTFPAFNGDQLNSVNFDLALDTDNNSQTGCISDHGAEALLGFGLAHENGRVHTNGPSSFAGPTSIEMPELARYKNLVWDVIHFGGEGRNYITMAFPLSPLGITGGQEITIGAWIESSSERYHHASFDPLNPESVPFDLPSLGCSITFRLGEEIVIK